MKKILSFYQVAAVVSGLISMSPSSVLAQQEVSSGRQGYQAQSPVTPCRTVAEESSNFSTNPFWKTDGAIPAVIEKGGGTQPTVYARTNDMLSPFWSASNNELSSGVQGDPSQKDFYEEDGWQLAYKDFGSFQADGITPRRGVRYPYFVLYNKYKGVLRAFFYNEYTGSTSLYNYAKLSLSFRSNNPQSAIFSHNETDSRLYADDYSSLNGLTRDEDLTQVALVKITQGKVWIWADFDLAGYDPSEKNTVLTLTVSPFQEAQISTTLKARLDARAQIPIKGESNGPLSIIKNASEFFSNASTVADSYTSKGIDALKFAKGLLGSFNPAFGVIQSFIGLLAPKSAGFEEIKISGNIEGDISGTESTNRADGQTVNLMLKDDGLCSSDLIRPVQPISWGVFSVNSSVPSPTYTCDYPSTGKLVYVNPVNLDVRVNPSLQPYLVDISAKYVFDYFQPTQSYPGSDYVTLAQFSSTNYQDRIIVYREGSNPVDRRIKGLMVRARFNIPGAVMYNNGFMGVEKFYPLTANIGQYTGYGSCGGRGRLGVESEVANGNESELSVYPNPFLTQMTVKYRPKTANKIDVKVYNSNGKCLKNWQLENKGEEQTVSWNGTDTNGQQAVPGLYIIEVNDGEFRTSSKLIKQ